MKTVIKMLVALTALAMLGSFFVSCSDDDSGNSDSNGNGGSPVMLDFDISSFSDGLYYAQDPDLEDVEWYLRLKDSDWAFGAKIPNGYYGDEIWYDFDHFYKGTFTVDDDTISLTKTHRVKANGNITWMPTYEEIVDHGVSNDEIWYSSEKSNWKSGTLSNSKLSIQFTTSELDYNVVTQQKVMTIPELKRN